MWATCCGMRRTATGTLERPCGSATCGSARATILAEVRSARVRPTRRRNLRIVEAAVADRSVRPRPSGSTRLARRAPASRDAGAPVWEARPRGSSRVFAHELLQGDRVAVPGYTVGLVPVHPVGRAQRRPGQGMGLGRAGPCAGCCRGASGRARARRRLAAVADALFAIHFPDDAEAAASARERLAFEELFLHQVALASAPPGTVRPGRASRSIRRAS